MSKYRLLRERLAQSSRFTPQQFKLPHAATDDELLLVHTPEYMQKIKTGDLTKTEARRIGFPWSEKLIERSRRSTGATICAARDAFEHRVAANLAGGTHHAFSDSAEGYCVFNDVCVAARVLQSEQLIERAIVVDCDVHQGNGTAEICQNDPTIFTFSMHCEKNFPFRKQTSDLDISLPEGTGDDEYVRQLLDALHSIKKVFIPDIVFYIAGADPYEYDRLGKLKLTKDGLRLRDKIVFEFCQRMNKPVAISMAGGYAKNVEDIVDVHARTIGLGYSLLSFDAKPDNPP